MSTEDPTRRGPGRPRVSQPEPAPGVAASPESSETASRETSASAQQAEADPRARAAARAAQLREHLGGMEEGVDKFYIDPRIIPDGWSYEWKRQEVLGKPDPSYQVSLARRGWEPVPRSRHPELMPDNFQGDCILREGMILMERPKEITDEVKAADYRRAREQVRAKETQLGAAPPGTFERDNKGNPMATVKKSYGSIPVPEK